MMNYADHVSNDGPPFRENADGTLVCSHRDLSVCPECAKAPEVVEVVGAHYWDRTGELRAELAKPRCTICGDDDIVLGYPDEDAICHECNFEQLAQDDDASSLDQEMSR